MFVKPIIIIEVLWEDKRRQGDSKEGKSASGVYNTLPPTFDFIQDIFAFFY